MTYPVLPGFVGFREAMRLGYSTWGVASEGRIFGLLIGGQLRGWVVEQDGSAHALPSGFWKNKDFKKVVIAGTLSASPVHFGELQFKSDDLKRALAPSEVDAPDAVVKMRTDLTNQRNPSVGKPRGRKPNNEHDAFWIEACRMVAKGEQAAEDGKKQTQRAFIDAMLKWSEKTMTEPYGPDAVEKKIKGLWRVLRNEGSK